MHSQQLGHYLFYVHVDLPTRAHWSLQGYPLQVLGCGAYVLCGDIPAAKRVHKPAKGTEHRLSLVGAWVRHDEPLATTSPLP